MLVEFKCAYRLMHRDLDCFRSPTTIVDWTSAESPVNTSLRLPITNPRKLPITHFWITSGFDNSLGTPLGLPCRSSVDCLDCVVANLLLMHGRDRSVGPRCNYDCKHKNLRQPSCLGRFLRR